MIIALKGYIGTGKTTISNLIAEKYDFNIINADEIVKELYENDELLKKKILVALRLSKFDKKEIAAIVFKDNEKLFLLESIVHPMLEKIINEKIQASEKDILLDCQIIDKLKISYDYEILLQASKNTIIQRVKKRDKKDDKLILDILNSQEKVKFQTAKIFPLNTDNNENLEKDLEKIMKIFYKEQNYQKMSEGFDDEEDW